MSGAQNVSGVERSREHHKLSQEAGRSWLQPRPRLHVAPVGTSGPRLSSRTPAVVSWEGLCCNDRRSVFTAGR